MYFDRSATQSEAIQPGWIAGRTPRDSVHRLLACGSGDRVLAGQTAVQQFTALIRATAAEQTAQFQTGLTTVNARLDAVEKQLGRIWAFLFLLLATLLGTLTTLVATLLLRG